jgi:hypothetical protein
MSPSSYSGGFMFKSLPDSCLSLLQQLIWLSVFQILRCLVQLIHDSAVTLSPMAWQPFVDQGLLITEVSLSHSDKPNSVELLWTSDHPAADNSTWQHKPLTRVRHPCRRRYSNPLYQQVSGLWPHGHWDQSTMTVLYMWPVSHLSACPVSYPLLIWLMHAMQSVLLKSGINRDEINFAKGDTL